MTTQRNGRATACKQSAPQKVHRWTDLILAGELPEGIAGCPICHSCRTHLHRHLAIASCSVSYLAF